MSFVLWVCEGDDLRHDRGNVIDHERVDSTVLGKSKRKYIHRHWHLVLHVKGINRTSNLSLVPPVDNDLDWFGPSRDDADEGRVVVTNFIYDLTKSFFVDLRIIVVLGRISRIMHHKVFHVDARRLVSWSRDVSGSTEVLLPYHPFCSFWLALCLLHVVVRIVLVINLCRRLLLIIVLRCSLSSYSLGLLYLSGRLLDMRLYFGTNTLIWWTWNRVNILVEVNFV